jgi:TetR/AcrR family transcriptional regulator, transcriptional repressor for nem operon
MNQFWNERCKIARPKAFNREKALIQALQLFWRKGYMATSLQDLVETLHLSRSSLYDTFGDKRTLFLEALKLYSERVISRMARTLNESPSVRAGIQTLFDELTAGVGSQSGAMGCFMVNSVAELVPYDPDVTEIAAAYSDALQRLLTEALTQAALQGTVASKQAPEQLAAYVFNAMQGIRILIKSGATREQAQAIGAITLDSLQ